jgi:hypothetical protein
MEGLLDIFWNEIFHARQNGGAFHAPDYPGGDFVYLVSVRDPHGGCGVVNRTCHLCPVHLPVCSRF